MTLILIKKDTFYFRKSKYWVLDPLDASAFKVEGEAQAYIKSHLKEQDCKVVKVEVIFKEK